MSVLKILRLDRKVPLANEERIVAESGRWRRKMPLELNLLVLVSPSSPTMRLASARTERMGNACLPTHDKINGLNDDLSILNVATMV